MIREFDNPYSEYNFEKLKGFVELICRRGADPEELTMRLVDKSSGVDSLFATPEDELSDTLGEEGALLVRIAAQITSRRYTERFAFGTPKSQFRICEYLKARLMCELNETILVIPLDENNTPLCCEVASSGSVNASDITGRTIAEIAYSVRSKRVVVAHNHPRGLAKASDEDLETTKALALALKKANVTLCYHVITAGQDCDIIDDIAIISPPEPPKPQAFLTEENAAIFNK